MLHDKKSCYQTSASSEDCKEIKVYVRAMDTAFNSQPETLEQIKNGTMYVNNSWHNITLQF